MQSPFIDVTVTVDGAYQNEDECPEMYKTLNAIISRFLNANDSEHAVERLDALPSTFCLEKWSEKVRLCADWSSEKERQDHEDELLDAMRPFKIDEYWFRYYATGGRPEPWRAAHWEAGSNKP